jgi:hypothetical protein
MYQEDDKDEDTKFLSSTTTPPQQVRRIPRAELILQVSTFIISALILALYTINNTSSSSFHKHPVAADGILPVGMSRVNPTTAHQLKPCGMDAATARSNGCIFDLLTMSWLAPECYDKDLSEAFLEVASEPFFYDMEATRPIKDYVELSEVTQTVYTTRKYHIYHCSYGWRMMHRALVRGGALESGLSGYHHTEHCTDQLMNQTISFDKVITKIIIDFPDC